MNWNQHFSCKKLEPSNWNNQTKYYLGHYVCQVCFTLPTSHYILQRDSLSHHPSHKVTSWFSRARFTVESGSVGSRVKRLLPLNFKAGRLWGLKVTAMRAWKHGSVFRFCWQQWSWLKFENHLIKASTTTSFFWWRFPVSNSKNWLVVSDYVFYGLRMCHKFGNIHMYQKNIYKNILIKTYIYI